MRFINILLIILLFFYSLSCSRKEHKTLIKGNIPNLPDGTLYLYKDESGSRIDSTDTKNGVFQLVHQWRGNIEPVYLGLDHIDHKGVLRAFSFPTNARYKGAGWEFQYFFSDSVIAINGKLKDFVTKDLELSEKYKLVTSPVITAGRQTEVLYHTDRDLFEDITPEKINSIKEKIQQYPYSYHLLYQLERNKNNFSVHHMKDFLNIFRGDITQSGTYKKLLAYNLKRSDQKYLALPLLEEANGMKAKILDSAYKKHLVIFWASWCGPCREEIPLLKKEHDKKNPLVEFVSISIDTDKTLWKKAIQEEQMTWKQLIVSNGTPAYEDLQIHFKFNNAIPYTVLVDNNLKILAFSVGLSSEKDLNKLIETD
ncbi:TlpA disulfide reductase family protein [Elizabethkingia meningoseptica]|uniref:TlpA disulfide reductase family protein n=1 Tax=Elizabethkingia meningoseptica TaxID=238 RepID=UPI002013AFEA|nr:TlpA disulfide reductase family protein [Elizabethkingia meningoseptica]MCL1674363.1 AhpC/TSA family protein [Elizabethkingia meningoseptica]MCL1686016.1 AhpC/TSA family protein [Elizabethkingia meningoseptica]